MMNYTKKRHFINRDNHAYSFSYNLWGEEDNPEVIFCVHGLTRNSHDFDFIAAELSRKYRVITPSIVGRGDSDRLSDPMKYNYQTYLLDMNNFIASLKLSKIDWLGTSMGGIIGMLVSGANPDLINNLILNDIGTFLPKNALVRIAKYAGSNPQFNNLTDAKYHLKIYLANFGIKEDEHWDYLLKHTYTLNDEGKYVLNYDPAIAETFSKDAIKDVTLDSIWEKVNFNRALLIRGEKSDIFLQENAQEMLKSKDNIDYIEFKNVGHAPALMDKEQIQHILNWLGL